MTEKLLTGTLSLNTTNQQQVLVSDCHFGISPVNYSDSVWFYYTVVCPKDADGMANSVDPDQTAMDAVLSGSTLFAKTFLSK